MDSDLYGQMLLYGILGLIGGGCAALGDKRATAVPMVLVIRQAIAGIASGISLGMLALYRWPESAPLHALSSVLGGIAGPFVVFSVLLDKLPRILRAFFADSSDPRPPANPPGDKP